MSIDLSLLSQFQTGALGLSNLLLVDPEDDKGISPQITPANRFLFSDFGFEGENVIQMDCDITDHYIEDNTAIQDNIAIKPIIVTTQGFIGELNDIFPGSSSGVPQLVQSKLGVISNYTPNLSIAAQIAYNAAFQAYQLAQTVSSTVKSWRGANQNKQQIAFQQFVGYRANRVLFTVQTPWQVLKNMAILNMRATQDAETKLISEFTITFKQMQFVSASTSAVQDDGSRYFTQADGTVTIGQNTPIPSVSFLDVGPQAYP